MLKYNIKHITTLLFILICIGCEDEYISTDKFMPSLEAHYLRCSENDFFFYASKEASEQFNVESMNTSWRFSEVPDWISISPNSGNESSSVCLTVSENIYESGRSSIFYLQSSLPEWDFSRALSCNQSGASAKLTIDNTSLTFGGGTETQTVKVEANCTWSATSSDSWISLKVDKDNGELKVSVSPNSGKYYRYSTITIEYGKNGKSYKNINISQSPADIKSSVTSLEYENVASAYNITVESEADWSAATSASWINISPKSGTSGKTDVTIEVSPNTRVESRTGQVLFYTGSESKLQIDIVQRGLYIETAEEIYFGASEESLTLNINSNTDWQVFSSPNWITLSKTSGSGDDTILITASDNPNSTNRSGEIVLGYQGLDINFTVHVEQRGKSLATLSNLLEFSDKAGSNTFRVISNTNWTSICSDTWFNATPNEGVGDAEVNVSVSENLSSTERTGNIEYKYADASRSVIVSQLAKYLTIDDKTFDFASTGGSHIIDIATNDKWTAEVEHNVSWLRLSSSSGDGDTQLVITAEDNPTINVRSTAVIIKSDYSQDVRILISQQPRTLSINTQKILFFAKGGYSENIQVTTEGKYGITSDATWFTISEGKGNTFRIYAAKNSAEDFREGIVTIYLTDLEDCSLSIDLPVVQAGQGGSFIIGGFQEDVDWDKINSGELTISVSHYTTDKNWDNTLGGTLKVSTTGYSSDDDWNRNDNANGRATITGYGEDKNWNERNSNNNGLVISDGYTNDNNWDNNSSNTGDITGSDYSNDNNWDE